jgi:hypothetical protein
VKLKYEIHLPGYRHAILAATSKSGSVDGRCSDRASSVGAIRPYAEYITFASSNVRPRLRNIQMELDASPS